MVILFPLAAQQVHHSGETDRVCISSVVKRRQLQGRPNGGSALCVLIEREMLSQQNAWIYREVCELRKKLE